MWQEQFALSYMGLAVVRALYYGTMGGLQLPADRFTSRLKPRSALALSTFVAAVGFVAMALPTGFAVCASDSSLPESDQAYNIRAPRSSWPVVTAQSRAGHWGSTISPAIWEKQPCLQLLPFYCRYCLGEPSLDLWACLVFSSHPRLLAVVPNEARITSIRQEPERKRKSRSGFGVLLSIGVLDTATRMGYLLFLPFLIHARGGSSATVGLGLALLFVGGALGKASCGWLGQRVGVVGSVVGTEIATAALIVVTCFTPIIAMLVFLPPLGVFLNGTSSVLYGTVPELAPKGNTGRAFALFYTGVIGSSGLAPIAYGAIADHSSQTHRYSFVGVHRRGHCAAAFKPS